MSGTYQRDNSEIRSPLIASWLLLGITCLISLIPFLGFLAWFIGSATIVIAFVLGIVIVSKGGTWSGVFVLLAAIIVVPVFILFAPIVTSIVTGAALDSNREKDSPVAIEESTSVAGDHGEAEIPNPKAGEVPPSPESAPVPKKEKTSPSPEKEAGSPEPLIEPLAEKTQEKADAPAGEKEEIKGEKNGSLD